MANKHPSIDPGIVDTKATTYDIHEAYPLLGYGMSVLLKPFQKGKPGVFSHVVDNIFALCSDNKAIPYALCVRGPQHADASW